MALPTTGSLSGDQIDDEFPDNIDNGRPMSLSEYRGFNGIKDGIVYNLPTISQNNPTGKIAYSDFRGFAYGYFVDILVVGGGGGGGASRGGRSAGGGGGGGYARSINNLFVVPGSRYNIFVGRGGAGGVFPGNVGEGGTIVSQGMDGTNSTFDYNQTIYTGRGGGGGGGCRVVSELVGRSGGCGGGAGAAQGLQYPTNPIPGGNGNPGFDGGDADASSTNREGGGGGGTTSEGGFAQVNPPIGGNGIGGNGFNLGAWMGTATYRTGNRSYNDGLIGSGTVNDGGGVGGGGGGGRTTGNDYVQGRDGGGWGCFPSNNRSNTGDQLRDGINLTGGGGGGGCESNGAGGGGSGVVIIRYPGTTVLGSGVGGTIYTGKVNNVDYVFHVFGNSTNYTSNVNTSFIA